MGSYLVYMLFKHVRPILENHDIVIHFHNSTHYRSWIDDVHNLCTAVEAQVKFESDTII